VSSSVHVVEFVMDAVLLRARMAVVRCEHQRHVEGAKAVGPPAALEGVITADDCTRRYAHVAFTEGGVV
jgi:hypothetical protein